MSNFNPESYFQLDVDAPLFRALYSEKPSWWEVVKNDSRVYINIRKGGYINVYCRGESIMKLEYSRGNYRSTTNTYYLSDKEKKGKVVQLSPDVIVKRLDEIVDRMLRRRPVGKEEGDSEEGIKGELFLSGKYIDTEFAYMRRARPSEIESRKKRIKPGTEHRISQYAQDRIDLIRVDNGAIQYVELKRISDPRLNKHNREYGQEAEIIEQLNDYQFIIDTYKDKILTYYQSLQQVMKALGIKNQVVNQQITRVSDFVELYIAGYNDGKAFSQKRHNKILNLKNLLIDNHISHSNIDTVLNNYLKLKKA